MDLTKLNLRSVLYYMDKFTIDVGGKTFDVPRSMIVSIDISKDFESMIYPLWYISVNVPLWYYTEIAKSPDNISVTMNLQYTLGTDLENLNRGKDIFISEITGKFKAVVPYTTQLGDSTIQTNFEKDNSTYNKNYTFNEYAVVELALYNTAAYAASFNTINAVLTSTNMTNAFAYCINQCGINNVIISKCDNNTVYSEFKILPVSGVKNMLRIVEDYNFHKEGSVLFFDLVDSYLVAKKPGCFAWKTNEYMNTYIISIAEFSDTMANFCGIDAVPNDKANIVAIDKKSYTTEKFDGAPILKDDGDCEVLKIITYQGRFNMFTPNKKFVLSIDTPNNKKYNGVYRLYSMDCVMTPAGEFLRPRFTVRLRK